ncbi:MAG: response regulator [Aeromicrobium sp.]|uniref:response regulator n=1 Tax=Aeromicrobium sp. TaxID=1871063 RepID=UPI0039E5A3AD
MEEGNGRRVLVIDDTASIRFLIRMNLELAGFEVTEAVDGVAGLEALRSGEPPPDAVTVDVMMPRLDGFAVVQAIRADPRLAHLVVVMVTTQGHPAMIQQGRDAAVDAYIVKPFDPDYLVQTVADLTAPGRR